MVVLTNIEVLATILLVFTCPGEERTGDSAIDGHYPGSKKKLDVSPKDLAMVSKLT